MNHCVIATKVAISGCWQEIPCQAREDGGGVIQRSKMESAEIFTYLRAAFALTFVVGLIFLAAIIAKKSGWDKKLVGNKSSQKRMQVMETLYLDPKHRLVMVKCNDLEHVLMLGVGGNLVVSSNPAKVSVSDEK
ncbi:MAG: flagellar biosynthetic protein FliO [Pseudomonadota bacterium]